MYTKWKDSAFYANKLLVKGLLFLTYTNVFGVVYPVNIDYKV